MVSIWQQQVLFQSLDFISSLLLIYHPNCWGQLLSVKWGQACNILQWNHICYRIIFGQRMLQFTKYRIQNSAHLSKRHLSDVMSSNCFCTVLFPKSSQLFGIRVLIFHPNLRGTNVANNSFAQILVSRLCTLDRFQYASLRAFTLGRYDIILLTCSSHQHATTFSQEVICCFDVFSLTELEKGSAHARLERHPVKFQKVKEWKIKKYTFRLFDFLTFRLFSFPLDSQRF
jgi:hypothetical protein